MAQESQSKKRIIVVSAGDSFWIEPHLRAFRELGFDCTSFDNRRGLVYSSPMLKKLMRVFPRLRILKKLTLDRTNRQLISLVKRYKPFLVFGIKAESIYPETVAAIRKLGVLTGLFFIDFMDHWELIKILAPAYDYFFSQDHVILRRLWQELGLKNCFYMAHSTEPLPDPFTDRRDKYGVSFIGQYDNVLYPNREKYLLAVKDMDLNIWGTENWANSPLKDHFRGRSHGDQRFDIYGHSKIVLDINWSVMPVEGLSNRPFEVMGSGACYFIDNKREDIRRCYADDEYVMFTDEKDMRDKVEYYLKHDEERERIARAGYAKTVAAHTYVNRVRQLLDTIEHPEKYLYK